MEDEPEFVADFSSPTTEQIARSRLFLAQKHLVNERDVKKMLAVLARVKSLEHAAGKERFSLEGLVATKRFYHPGLERFLSSSPQSDDPEFEKRRVMLVERYERIYYLEKKELRTLNALADYLQGTEVLGDVN